MLQDPNAKNTESIARNHVVHVDSSSGLVRSCLDLPYLQQSHRLLFVLLSMAQITVTGGKWTTYREMAEDAVNAAVKLVRDPSVFPLRAALIHFGCAWLPPLAGEFARRPVRVSADAPAGRRGVVAAALREADPAVRRAEQRGAAPQHHLRSARRPRTRIGYVLGAPALCQLRLPRRSPHLPRLPLMPHCLVPVSPSACRLQMTR